MSAGGYPPGAASDKRAPYNERNEDTFHEREYEREDDYEMDDEEFQEIEQLENELTK